MKNVFHVTLVLLRIYSLGNDKEFLGIENIHTFILIITFDILNSFFV